MTITEKKTGKVRTIALNPRVLNALSLLFSRKRDGYIFVSNRRDGKAISRVQAWRIIRAAAEAVGAVGRVGCHSLRKTFGYFAWKAGVLPVMLMDIYNHSSFEITRRYLGISQEDRDKVYLEVSLF
jgi:integrase